MQGHFGTLLLQNVILGSHISIRFSLLPAHINISYNNDNVNIMRRKTGGHKTVLMNVRPQTLTVVNYEHIIVYNS